MNRDSHSASTTGVTPIPISPRGRTVLVLVAFALLILLFWWSPGLLPLLLAGATLALILSFPVRLLARILPRGWAIAVVILALLLLVALALVTLVPLLIRQLAELIVAAPQLATDAEAGVLRLLRPLAERGLLPDEPGEVVANIRQGLLERAQGLAQRALGGVVGFLTGAVGTFIQLFGVLFIAIYLLADIGRFKDTFVRAVPERYRRDARALWDDLGRSLSRYLSGLLVSLAIQGTLAYLLNLALGVPYAFLLGILTAVTGILPYIGAWIGAIPAVILAFFVSPWTAVLSALGYVALQQLEGEVLTPRIQGTAVRVHPLLVFLAVVAGGEIAGLLGAAFAVPLLAVLRVLFDFFSARLYVRQPVQAAAVTPITAAPEVAAVPVTAAVPPTGPAVARRAEASPWEGQPEHPRPAHRGEGDG
ncbi:MAG: AI-2E family transporter [Chloroflexota bacterium]|nr:AI-2E family transporter [Chloroflexota bacterium]